jgi:hypothetical protein
LKPVSVERKSALHLRKRRRGGDAPPKGTLFERRLYEFTQTVPASRARVVRIACFVSSAVRRRGSVRRLKGKVGNEEVDKGGDREGKGGEERKQDELVKTPAARPKIESLAISSASSSVLKVRTEATGPKIYA